MNTKQIQGIVIIIIMNTYACSSRNVKPAQQYVAVRIKKPIKNPKNIKIKIKIKTLKIEISQSTTQFQGNYDKFNIFFKF